LERNQQNQELRTRHVFDIDEPALLVASFEIAVDLLQRESPI
jgi:hypothetical protein